MVVQTALLFEAGGTAHAWNTAYISGVIIVIIIHYGPFQGEYLVQILKIKGKTKKLSTSTDFNRHHRKELKIFKKFTDYILLLTGWLYTT